MPLTKAGSNRTSRSACIPKARNEAPSSCAGILNCARAGASAQAADAVKASVAELAKAMTLR